jgi:UDP-glucose 4-epimerase
MDQVFGPFKDNNGALVRPLFEPFPHVTVSPAVRGGYPVVKGTRVPYDNVATLIRDGVVVLDGHTGQAAMATDGGGVLTLADVASALGWYSVPLPKPLLDAAAEVVPRLPLLPDSATWIHTLRKPVLMKTDRARRLLGWRPQHTAKATLSAMAEAVQSARR